MMLTILLIQKGSAQDFELDTREVLDVIKKWNFASNAMSESTLREIYSDQLIFYSKNRSENESIALKRSFFRSNPAFKQKITSDPSFKPFTGGVIKADFTKEVFENGKWRKYRAYLLISYERNRYLIVGESDLETDRKNGYRLAIGKPMDIPQSPSADTTTISDFGIDTGIADIDSSFADAADSTANSLSEQTEDSTLITAVTDEVLSDETVAVPKKYVYFLIGFLVLTALIVVIARKPGKSSRKFPDRPSNPNGMRVNKNDKAFETFVLALFDPHYFTVKAPTKEHVYAGNVKRSVFEPALEFEFENKDSRARIAIECIFIPGISSVELFSYSSNQINRYHDYEEGTGTEVYLIIGLDGEAGDPKELFLIPASELREGYWGYKDLQPFKKHGMFFYNSSRQRLL